MIWRILVSILQTEVILAYTSFSLSSVNKRNDDCNWTRTHSQLVHKRTLNYLVKWLTKWLTVRL